MSIAGKTRDSASLRVRSISMLPVPLNSSKITSSILEPVSISAVAMIVNDPPSSILRAAPKKRFGLCSDAVSRPPESVRPELVMVWLYARARRVIESSRITTSLPSSTRRFARSIASSATAVWFSGCSSKVEATTSPSIVRCMSVTSSGRSSTKQRDDVRVGMIDRNRVGDVFQQRRLAGFRRRDDQRALAFADRREQVDDARRQLRRTNFEFKPLLRIDRRSFFEGATPFDRFGIEPVDLVDANQDRNIFRSLSDGERGLRPYRRAAVRNGGSAIG